MLSMKTLRVAIVTMGSALLLGPGMVLAEVTNLSARSPAATTFAAETLQDTTDTVFTETATNAKHFNVDGGSSTAADAADGLDVIFRPGLNLDADDEYHFRVEVDGMIFRGAGPTMGSGLTTDDDSNPATPNVSPTSYTAWGPALRTGVGSSVAVFELSEAVTTASEVKIELSEVLAVGSLNPASYGITVTMHRDQFDAIDGVGAVASSSVGGSATLARVVNAIGADVVNGRATASVDVDYRWFAGPTPVAELGTAAVNMRMIAGTTIMDARDGEMVAPINFADDGQGGSEAMGLINEGGVSINIEGDTSIGAFAVVPKTAGTPAECGLNAGGHSAENPLEGIESNPAPGTNTQSGLTTGQMYALCVNVDTEGPETNTNPIEAQTFSANVSIAPGASTVWGEARSVLLGSGTIGTIIRDGTHQRVTYLTASDKYNQRLIIVNNSGKMVRYDLVSMTTEDGTTVTLSDAAMAAKEAGLNTIMPRSQVVLRVGDILDFDGKNRAAATVTVNSNPGNISVATTQVNLEDGSTDTVVYGD